jgi:hypothetical protein
MPDHPLGKWGWSGHPEPFTGWPKPENPRSNPSTRSYFHPQLPKFNQISTKLRTRSIKGNYNLKEITKIINLGNYNITLRFLKQNKKRFKGEKEKMTRERYLDFLWFLRAWVMSRLFFEKIIVYLLKLTMFFNSNTKVLIFAIHLHKVLIFFQLDQYYPKILILPLIFIFLFIFFINKKKKKKNKFGNAKNG